MKSLLSTSILVFFSLGCQDSNTDSSNDNPPENRDFDLSEDNERPTDGFSNSCLSWQKKGQDGKCYLACQTDDKGKEWCVAEGEQPSDIDPTKLVPECKHGFLNQGKCETKMELVSDSESIKLYVGETLRLEGNRDFLNLYDLALSPDHGYGFGLIYNYKTNYPIDILSRYDTMDASIYLDRNYNADEIKIWQISNVEAKERDIPKSLPIHYNFKGIKFKSSPITMDEYLEVCKAVDEFYPDTNINIQELAQNNPKTKESHCHAKSFYIHIVCNRDGENCSLDEVMFKWLYLE